MSDAAEVRVEKRFRHPPERVFDAFLNPETTGLWLFATPGGVMETAELDPRPGGGFHVVERRGGDLARHWGEFVVVERPRRIVFDFRTDPDAPWTRVTVTFAPAGDGCDVTLTHDLAPEWAAWADRTRHGWTTILDGLASTLDPGDAA